MNYCENCGSKIKSIQHVCLSCGVIIKTEFIKGDPGGALWSVLGFFCGPLIGLIFYLLLKDSTPKTAKAVAIGALVNLAASVLFSLLWLIYMASLFMH